MAAGVSLGSLYLELGLSTGDYDRALSAAKSAAIGVGKDIERHLKLKPKVEHGELKKLNQHLDLKQKHVAQVNSYFRSNPLTPRVDTSEVDAASSKLKALKANNGGTIRVAVSQAVTGSSGGSSNGVERAINALPDRIAKAIKPGAIGQAAGSIGRAVSSTVGSLAGNVLSIPANLAAEAGKGLLYGITQEVSKNLGGGLSTALERAASTSIGSTRLLGDKLGGQLGSMVVESFSDRLSLLTEVAEKAVEGISDQKLKKKLQETIADVKAAPQAIASQTQAAIGGEAIVQEGLFQRGQERQAQRSRMPVTREESIAQWRETVERAEKVEMAATQRLQSLQKQIQVKQAAAVKAQQAYAQIEQQIKTAQANNAAPEQLEDLAEQLKDSGRELEVLVQTVVSLTKAKTLTTNAIAEAKAERSKASQNAKLVRSPDQPQQYEEIARTLYGQEFDTEKLPQMVVADASLKQSGAVSQYDPLRNAIEVTTEMYEQVKAGMLTPEQITVLSEELAHARDFDFGSYQGIQAARQNRTVGETTAPTPEEFSEIAPNLGLYGEDRRALELSAKTEALRNTQAYLQRQKQGKGFSNASVFATGKDFFQNKEQELNARLAGFQAMAAKLGGNVDKVVETYKEVFDKIKSEFNELADQAVADAATGSLDEAKLADYSKRREALGSQLQTVEGKLTERIANYKVEPPPAPVATPEMGQLLQMPLAMQRQPEMVEVATAKPVTPEIKRAIAPAPTQVKTPAESVKQAASSAGQVARSTIEAAQKASATVQPAQVDIGNALNQAKEVSSKFSQAYTALKQAVKAGDLTKAEAFLGVIQANAERAKAEAKTAYSAMKSQGASPGELSQASSRIGQISKAEKLAQQQVAKLRKLQANAIDDASGAGLKAASLAPIKGAAAVAAVPQLAKLKERIQTRVAVSNDAKASGDDLKAQALNVAGISRSLNSKRQQMLEQVEQQIGNAIDALTLTLQNQPDLIDNAKVNRTLQRLNDMTERLLDERAEIIDDVFETEMRRANDELLAIGARAAKKVEEAPDLGLLADRAIDNQTQDQSQKVIRENEPEIRQNRRKAYQMEREGGAVVQERLKVLPPSEVQGFGSGLLKQAKTLLAGVNQDMNTAVQKRVAVLLTDAKSLSNDIETSRIVAKGEGDKQQAKALGKVGGQASSAIAKGDAILAKPQGKVTGKDLAELKAVEQALKKVYAQVDRPLPPDAGGFGGLAANAGGLLNVLKGLGLGFAAFQGLQAAGTFLKDFTMRSLEAAMTVDRLKTAMNFAAGGAGAGVGNFKFIEQTVDNLRIPLEAAREGFTKFSAATRGTKVEGQATKDVFLGLGQAATVLGLSSDDTSGAFLALGQMASKGKVQAEELRGQIGERIPGAFGIAARATGVTEAELNKMMETGSVVSEEFLPKFGEQLQKEFGGSAGEASKNAQSAMFAFQNELLRTQEKVGGFLQPAQMASFNLLAEVLKFIKNNFEVLAIAAVVAGTAITAQLIGVLIKVPIVAQLGAAGLGVLKGSLLALKAALGPMLIGFAALYVAVELGKNIFDRFVPSDLGKRFQDSTNGINTRLEEIAKKAAEARGELSKIAPKRESKGWIDDLQVGSDKFFSGAAAKIGVKWENTDTSAEAQTKNDIKAAQEAGTAAAKVTQVDPAQFEGALQTAKNTDDELKRLQFRKQFLQGQAAPDKKAIEAIDTQIATKSADRKKATESFNDQYGAVDTTLKAFKQNLDEIEKSGKSEAIKKQLREPFEQALPALQAAKDKMDALQKSVGTTVDPVRNLLSGFEEINVKLEETKRLADAAFAQRTFQINSNQLAGFSADVDATGKAGVARAEADRDRLTAQVQGTEAAISQTQASLRDPMVQQMLGSITTTGGKGITENSSITEIENAKKRLGDKDAGKKDVLDRLKAYREQRDKLPELQGQLAGSKLQVKEAGQQLVLTQLGRQTADDESKVKRAETDRNAKLRGQQSGIAVKRSKNLFYSDADAGIAEADLGIRQAESQRTSATARQDNVGASLKRIKESFDAGKISKEEYVRQERELGDQLVEARSKSAEAEAQIEEARAKKFEAVNRRRIEKVQELNADEESILKRRETLANAGFSTKQASLSLAKAKNTFYSDADAGVAEAGLGIQRAASQQQFAGDRAGLVDKQLQRVRQLYKQGAMSASEFHKQERDLIDQATDARAKGTEAAAALEEAYARRIEAVNRQRIEKIQEMNADEESILKRRESVANAKFVAQQAGLSMAKAKNSFFSETEAGVADADIGVQRAVSQQQFAGDRTGLLEKQLQREQELYKQGAMSASEFRKKERDLVDQITEARTKGTEAAAALEEAYARKVEASNRQKLDQIELLKKKAEAGIQLKATDQQTALQTSLLSSPAAGEQEQAQVARSSILIEQTASTARMALKQNELAQTKQLAAEGVISAKDAIEKEMQLTQELSDMRLQAAQREVQMAQMVKDSRAKLLTELARLENEQIDRSKQLLDSQASLAKAQSDLSIARSSTQLNTTDRAFGLRERLETDKNLNPEVRATIERQLGQSGFGGMDSTGILKQRAAIENDIAAKQVAARETEFDFARKSLEIDLRKQEIATRTLAIEAQKYKLDSDRAKLQAIKDYSTAQASGDESGMRMAGMSLDTAANMGKLADAQLAAAQENMGVQKQIAENSRIQLVLSQERIREEFAGQDSVRRQNNELSIVEQAVKAKTPARALGGFVNAGQSYLVGERGPEMFESKTGGRIYNADDTAKVFSAATTTPTIGGNSSSFGGMGSGSVDAKLDKLISVIGAALGRPHLTVSSPQPVNDAARIYSEISAQQVSNANI